MSKTPSDMLGARIAIAKNAHLIVQFGTTNAISSEDIMNPQRTGWFSGGQIPCEPVPPLNAHSYRLVLLGPPGVGKGTQAQLLSESLRACHLSTGDLFRSAKCEGTTSPAMKQALDAMQRGELISDELVIAMVSERVECLRCRGGFLLDGFPRTVCQAEALEELSAKLGVKLDAALCFELEVEEIVARLSGRRTCESCRAIFNVIARPDGDTCMCDQCGGRLMQRDDDKPEAIRVRMRVYEEESRPLIEFYEQIGTLIRVEAAGSPQEIFRRTLSLLEQHRSSADVMGASTPTKATAAN